MHMLSVIDLDSDRKIEIKLGKVFTASALYTSSCSAAENQVKVNDRAYSVQKLNRNILRAEMRCRNRANIWSENNLKLLPKRETIVFFFAQITNMGQILDGGIF